MNSILISSTLTSLRSPSYSGESSIDLAQTSLSSSTYSQSQEQVNQQQQQQTNIKNHKKERRVKTIESINSLQETDSSTMTGKGCSYSQRMVSEQNKLKKQITKPAKVSLRDRKGSKKLSTIKPNAIKFTYKQQFSRSVDLSNTNHSNRSFHLLGGILLFNQSLNIEKKSSINSEIQCVQYENHVFNNYLALKLQYQSEPLTELPKQTQLVQNDKEQLINQHITQYQRVKEYIKETFFEDVYQETIPLIISQRECIQNEQITKYINNKFDDFSFYSFFVFSTDFTHEEVNLNRIGFSYKLLNFLNFNYSNCSLFQCQQLLTEFLSIQEYDKLQSKYFHKNSSNKQRVNSDQLQINTFDNLLITCSITLEEVNFEYPPHISQFFKNLNERVYFIKFQIDQSHISTISSLRIENLLKLQLSQSINSNVYSQTCQEFIGKYYNEEIQIKKEIELINKTEEEAAANIAVTQFSLPILRNSSNHNNYPEINLPLTGQKDRLTQKQILNKSTDLPAYHQNQKESQRGLNDLDLKASHLSWSISTKESIEDNKNDMIQEFEALIKRKEGINHYEVDEEDEEEDNEEDIDILLLKIRIIQQYQEKMKQLKLQERQNSIKQQLQLQQQIQFQQNYISNNYQLYYPETNYINKFTTNQNYSDQERVQVDDQLEQQQHQQQQQQQNVYQSRLNIQEELFNYHSRFNNDQSNYEQEESRDDTNMDQNSIQLGHSYLLNEQHSNSYQFIKKLPSFLNLD